MAEKPSEAEADVLYAQAAAAMDAGDGIKALSLYLQASGARATFDSRRNVTHACWRCGTTDAPRTLVAIGTYTRPMGGAIEPGDPIERPLCAACEEATRA